METTLKTCSALLVLLCCCLSGVQAQEDSNNHSSSAPVDMASVGGRPAEDQIERPGAETEMGDPAAGPDVWTEFATLRDKVTEMRVELRWMQRHGEELQKQNDAQNVELEATYLKLQDLETRLIVSESQVDNLKEELATSKVAFSASLLASSDGNMGSASDYLTLIYENVFTNIGNHYSPFTGYFTAPKKGMYFFRFTCYTVYEPESHNVHRSRLFLNDNPIVMTGDSFHHPEDREDSGSNGVVLQLEVGDVVSIKVHGYVWDDHYHRTTFSGFLLFPL